MGSKRVEREIPGFFSLTKPLADLGLEVHWPELEIRLSSSGVEKMWIVDESSRKLLDVVRDEFDRSVGGEGVKYTILHRLAVQGNEDLLRRLLSLGLNPDVTTEEIDGDRSTPAHSGSRNANVACVESFALCRADPAAVNSEGLTPAKRAEMYLDLLKSEKTKSKEQEDEIERLRKICTIWEIVRLSGTPSLAQLAFSGQWWAVKNLCRRKAVDLDEIRSKYRGKDVVEWARFHGANELADEIRYLFNYPVNEEPSRDAAEDNDRAVLQEMMLTFGERFSSFEEQLKDLDSRVRAQQSSTDQLKSTSVPKRMHDEVGVSRGGQLQTQSETQETTGGDGCRDPALEVLDVMFKEIRSRAVTAGQTFNVVAKLGATLEWLRSIDHSN